MDTLVSLSQRHAEARDMLADLFARHDRVFLAFSGGKESLALARLCDSWVGRFRLLWANTGYAFPHVEALIRSYGERYGLEERWSDLIANWKANGLPSNVVPIPNALGGGLHAEPKLQAWPACCGALRSNVRWCSDHLEIHARNREVVRILFMLDACDREVIAWSAVANAGISGEMVRDLMVTAVERRFGTIKIPHAVEWLSDNGSAYIARDTADAARALGLTLLFTPVRSPQSNACPRPSSKP